MIVMAVVIIGIAVAVGISQLGSSALNANRDGLRNDCASIISQAQMWYRTPTSMGGGGNTYTGITAAKIGSKGIDASGNIVNSNGSYAISAPDANSVRCVGTGTEKTSGGETLTVTMTYYAANDSTAYSDNM